ncbi:MAG: hypothetical protein MUE40_18525 [Anaerolineae bacterium]|jgi:ATP-dependent Clp protease ATP-binding subunit ClpA|nr:hypothetical protein [Anaerolineae bacterium]
MSTSLHHSLQQEKYLERFTRRARRVLWLAVDVATAAGHRTLEPEHVLVGLALEKGSISQAALQELNITSAMLRTLLLGRMPARPGTAGDPGEMLPMSGATEEALHLAQETAAGMGNPFVGTEHLLLAVMQQSKYGVLSMIRDAGTTPDVVMRRVQRVLQSLPRSTAMETVESGAFAGVVRQAIQVAEEARHSRLEPEHLLLALWLLEFAPLRQTLGDLSLQEAQLRRLIQTLPVPPLETGKAPERSYAAQLLITDAEGIAGRSGRAVLPYDLFFKLMTDRRTLTRWLPALGIAADRLPPLLLRYGIHTRPARGWLRR